MTAARIKSYVLLLLVAVIWGIGGPVIKLTLNGVSPELFLLYRFFISGVITLFIMTFFRLRIPRRPKVFMQLLLYGFINSTLTLGLLFWGTDKTTLLDMSLISLFGPLLSIFFGYLFFRDRITKREKLGIMIAFIGSFLILIEPLLNNHNGAPRLFGNILVMLSVVAGVASGAMTKSLLRKGVEADTLAHTSFLVGFVTLLPIVLRNMSFSSIVSTLVHLSLPYQAGVFYMAVLSGSVAYTMSNKALKTIELSEAAIFSYLFPIFSAILALLILGDKMTPIVTVGSIVTFIGVAIAEIKKRRYN